MQGVKAKNPHKAIRGFAYLLALGLPFAQVTALSRGIGLLCSLVLVLWTLMLARQAGQKRKRTALTWISLALLAWWSLATAFSLRPLDSGFALLEWALPFFAFFLYLRQSALPQQALRNLLAISGIAYLTLLAYAFLLSAFPGKAAIRPFFQDANFFAAALSLLLPGLFGLGMARQQPQKQKIIALAAAALLLLALIALRSRGAWVGLGGSGMLLIFLLLRNWWQRSLFLGISLSLGLFAIGIMQPYLAKRPTLPAAMRYLLSTSDVQTDFSNRERLMRWRCAWRMFKENPVMGRGPATYAPDFKHYLQNWS
ncbi:MAG TPA: O-antigen ligase domain-containing protein, partial [Bacteroidetes bacterium]|nr:O-antigen ligase domain-containing protein [Bacteroidota bacterium]